LDKVEDLFNILAGAIVSDNGGSKNIITYDNSVKDIYFVD
jgi:hypothetical protein